MEQFKGLFSSGRTCGGVEVCLEQYVCLGQQKGTPSSRSAAAEGRLELWKGVWNNMRKHGIVGGVWRSNRELEQGSVQEVGAWCRRRMLGQ